MINTNTVNTIDKNMLETEFFNKEFNFSYSSLNKLLESPQRFYKEYVLKDKEEKIAKYLLEGIVIHYLVLDGLDFDSKFIVAPQSLPSESSIEIINNVFKEYELDPDPSKSLGDYESVILKQLEEKNLHQRLKEDSKRIEKIADEKGIDYFEFLKIKENRTIIDAAILDRCSRRAEIIKADEKIRNLIGLDLEHDGTKIGVYNELELSMSLPNDKYSFGLKGIIDNLVVDVVNQIVTINDFKTTSKPIQKFEESVEYWNYWLQASVYKKLVKDFLSDVVNAGWIINFNFIVFDKYDQLYAFNVSDETFKKWDAMMFNTLEDAEYHFQSKEFKLPKAFALSNVKL